MESIHPRISGPVVLIEATGQQFLRHSASACCRVSSIAFINFLSQIERGRQFGQERLHASEVTLADLIKTGESENLPVAGLQHHAKFRVP
jgi:hypothetical protein